MNHNPTVSHPGVQDSRLRVTQDDAHGQHQGQSHDDMPETPQGTVPWYSDDEKLSPRSSKYYSELFALYTQQHIGDGAVEGDCNAASHPVTSRPESTITVFPGFVEYKTTPKSPSVIQRQLISDDPRGVQHQSFFKRYFRRAKEIYQNGPPGEAQMFWEGIKSYLKERERGVVLEICSPESNTVAVPNSHPQRAVAHGTTKSANKQIPRHDSAVSCGDISRTSRDIPVKLRQTVLNVDTNKRLPPSPPLSPAPKKRPRKNRGNVLNVNKALPRTPLPCSDTQRPAHRETIESPVDLHWPLTHRYTVGAKTSASRLETASFVLPRAQQSTSLADKAIDPPKPHVWGSGKSKASKEERAHEAFKAQISHPIPISPAFNPSTMVHQPHLLHTVEENTKDKHKLPPSPAWLAKLAHPTLPTMHKAKKRPDSDESFACQGLGDGIELDVYLGDGGPSVQDNGPRMRMGEDCGEMLRPKSLFTGRDSLYDVDDEWADQRRTGRWI